MAVKLGKKSRIFSKLGAKNLGKDLQTFGKKALHQLDIGERKLVNSLDKVAPVLAVGADLIVPGGGEAVLQANEGVQSLHKSGRRVIKELDELARAKRGDETTLAQDKLIGSIGNVRDDVNNLKSNLDNAKQTFTMA